jgi:glycosyltransferase involved in cell wall biosynthesis
VQTNLAAIRQLLLGQSIPNSVINITRHRKPEGDGVYYPKNTYQLLRLLRTVQYDIVHLHIGGNVTNRLLGLALVCCSWPGKKSVLTFHSGGYPSSPEGLKLHSHSIAAFVFRRFDRIVAVNQQIVDFFRRLGVPPEKIVFIHPHPLPVVDEHTPPLREDLQRFYDSHHPVLISVGLLEPEYDLPLQISAISRVREKFPDAGLVLIGSGSLEMDLRGLISSNADRDHILLCGDVSHPVTLRAVSQSDVMLRTTLYDGDAVSIREALHLNIPVIATDNGMRPANVHLIPKQNLVKLVDAVETTISQPFARNGANPTRNNIQAVLDLYAQLLSN